MNLDAIVIQAKPGERESLVLALRAIARALAVDWDYDELCAALGISLVAIGGPAETSPGLWLSWARDAFLAPAARLFGLHLRDLHPPDVGVDMLGAEEFPQHFELSYKPLIHRALENGQPVLAWRGWEGDAAPLWGVITAASGQDLLGVVPDAAGCRRLVGPALQCYVIEQHERRVPSADEVLAAAVAHADAYLAGAEGSFRHPGLGKLQIVTGQATYDAWAHWIEAQQSGGGDDSAREACRAYACSLCAARLSAMRFVQRCDVVQGPDQAAILDSMAGACEDLTIEISPFCQPEEIFALWDSAEGHQELIEAVRAAQAADRQLAACIRKLASTG